MHVGPFKLARSPIIQERVPFKVTFFADECFCGQNTPQKHWNFLIQMLDLVALVDKQVIMSSDAIMSALSICILSLILVVLVHLTVTRILLVRPEVAETFTETCCL